MPRSKLLNTLNNEWRQGRQSDDWLHRESIHRFINPQTRHCWTRLNEQIQQQNDWNVLGLSILRTTLPVCLIYVAPFHRSPSSPLVLNVSVFNYSSGLIASLYSVRVASKTEVPRRIAHSTPLWLCCTITMKCKTVHGQCTYFNWWHTRNN